MKLARSRASAEHIGESIELFLWTFLTLYQVYFHQVIIEELLPVKLAILLSLQVLYRPTITAILLDTTIFIVDLQTQIIWVFLYLDGSFWCVIGTSNTILMDRKRLWDSQISYNITLQIAMLVAPLPMAGDHHRKIRHSQWIFDTKTSSHCFPHFLWIVWLTKSDHFETNSRITSWYHRCRSLLLFQTHCLDLAVACQTFWLISYIHRFHPYTWTTIFVLSKLFSISSRRE